jgi:hypothetical protein
MEHIYSLERDNDMLARIVNVLVTVNTQFPEPLHTAQSAVVRPLRQVPM